MARQTDLMVSEVQSVLFISLYKYGVNFTVAIKDNCIYIVFT
jgi:hypothetical protein